MLGLAPGPGSPGARGGLFELHVRTDGNDSLCNGTKDRPADQAPNCAFRSLSAAVAAALPGVIVTIGPGTFSTGQIVFSQAITVRGQAGPPPTLTAQGGTTWLTCAGGVECTFENLAFDGGDLPAVTSGLRIESTGTLSDVTFSHLAGTALVLEGKTSVTRAKFHDLHKGIYVGSVAGSTITDSDFTAVDVGVSLSGGHATVETSRFRSVATAFDVFEGTLDESSELVITRNDLDDVDVYLLADAPFAAIAGRGNRLDGRLQFGTQETSSISLGSNWWRCFTGPDYGGANDCAKLPRATPRNWFGQSPWITFSTKAPGFARGPVDVTVDLAHRSDGSLTPVNLPDGIEATFSVPASKGTIPARAALAGGVIRARFVPGPADGPAAITVRLDETQATVPIVVDRKSPATLIRAPTTGARLKRLQRIAVAATDPAPRSGVAAVDVAIRRKIGKACTAWNGTTWVARPCSAKLWRAATHRPGGRWTFDLPQDAGARPGTYTIFTRARDRAGNASPPGFTPGKNQVTVSVVR